MTSEVIVDVQPKEISIALLEDKRLVEFQKEGRSASFVVGNIYLAKVRKLMPGLNACFVNVGYERDAFLHYLDLGPKFNSYTKYLKQVTSDKKKLYPIAKASNLPDLEKDGSVQNTPPQLLCRADHSEKSESISSDRVAIASFSSTPSATMPKGEGANASSPPCFAVQKSRPFSVNTRTSTSPSGLASRNRSSAHADDPPPTDNHKHNPPTNL